MKSVLSNLNDFFEIFGEQSFDNIDYRLSKFVIKHEIDDGNLYFNNLTKEMFLLSNAESVFDTENKKKMVERYFLFPKEFDELDFCDNVRSVYGVSRREEKGYRCFWILPTTDCNARCFYCYELGQSKRSMTMDVAKRTADYILRNKAEGKIQLAWFGGEPLFNSNVINVICEDLKKNGATFFSSMVTNGYLFDNVNVEKYKDAWNLDSVQITLDGTECVYNKIKSYVGISNSAYRKVLRNIKFLLEVGVNVHIRLNGSFHNLNDLEILIDELGQYLTGEKGFDIYVSPLFGEKFERKKERYEDLLLAIKKLNDKIEMLVFSKKESLNKFLASSNCMADSNGTIMILPDGNLGKCASFTDSNFVGNIYNDNIDFDALEKFKLRSQNLIQCSGCSLYPDCIRPQICDKQQHCYKEMRERRLEDTKQAMLNEYRSFLEREKENANKEYKVS
jgi:radical SAM protein with 4Fe4S-binding SPASM domain